MEVSTASKTQIFLKADLRGTVVRTVPLCYHWKQVSMVRRVSSQDTLTGIL